MSDIEVDIYVDFEQEVESTIGLKKSEQCITESIESGIGDTVSCAADDAQDVQMLLMSSET
jgi:hypothetical protein